MRSCKYIVIFLLLFLLPSIDIHAGYYSINIDYKTAASMTASYNTEAAMELLGKSSTDEILSHYKNAEVAAAGIYLTKFMDHRYLRDVGQMARRENAYYKRIYSLVVNSIIPKTVKVGYLLLQYPDRAPYWVPFLIKTCEDTKALCMQFEGVVTNGTLTFSDVAFPSVKTNIANAFDPAKMGGVDWQETLDGLADGWDDITLEDLQMDLDNIVAIGASIASAGSLSGDLVSSSNVGKRLSKVPNQIKELYSSIDKQMKTYSSSSIGTYVKGLLGGIDVNALANLFDFEGYDSESIVSNYLDYALESYYRQTYTIYKQRKGRGRSSRQTLYQETFDSYTMDKDVFEASINARLKDYKQQDENANLYTYYIEKGSKSYYTATDASRMHGVSTATYTVYCSDGQKLGQGSISWKENGNQGKRLTEQSKKFAMETTLDGGDDPTAELDAKVSEIEEEIRTVDAKISALEQECTDISAQMRDLGYDRKLMQEFQKKQKEIKKLKRQLSSLQTEYNQVKKVRDEAYEEYSGKIDEVTRIPSIMKELQTAYHLQWQGQGYWQGYTYIRKAKIPGMEGIVTFKANLSLQRKPSYFLGIRYHRAILQVDWTLTTEYSYSDVVEVMALDGALSDSEKAKKVNQRLSEIQQDYPDCTVKVECQQSKAVEDEQEEGQPHLLWASDRLAIARGVESRLVTIYTKLSMLQRYIETSKTLKDMLITSVMNGIDTSKRKSISIEALNRWKGSAKDAMTINKKEEDEED